MTKLLYLGCGVALGLAGAGNCAAQTPADSSALAAAVGAARQVYARTVRPESLLFDGPEYTDYAPTTTGGNPFFLVDKPQPGTVAYRGATFEAVPLRYDIALGQVVMSYPSQAVAIALVPEQLRAFTLAGHQFVRLVADSAARIPTGYYELLQAGPVSLLASHSKKVYQAYVQQALRLEYRQTDKLYLRTAKAATEISSLKNLLALLPAHRDEVQRYARQHKLRSGNEQLAASAQEALRYYYTLPQ